ncbi:MAG: hypothetical protein MI924_08820 [Chloroflexales bacterium]|nr:hypothetical protein [Chloroflexales bacterium]
MGSTRFLVWFDDNPKMPVVKKIEAAIEAYTRRFSGIIPNVVLVNEAEVIEHKDISVRGVSHIRSNTFWVGKEDVEAQA